MNYKNYFDLAKKIYKNEPTGHDFSHIKRCLSYVDFIQKKEGGNRFALIVATLFHDVHRVLSNSENKYITAEESIPYVENLLKEFNINTKDLKLILYLIQEHENKEKTDICLELKILQDADIIDALGKRGLIRTLTYCKDKKIPIYDQNVPLDSPDYIPNIFPISTTHYVYRTMIPNINLLKTEGGKQLGKKKIKILENFVAKNVRKYNLKISNEEITK